MASRPSDPLLSLIREVSRKRGLNTAALAKAAKLPRAQLKHILAGTEALTVDDLITLAQVLELGPAELGSLPMAAADDQPVPEEAGEQVQEAAALSMVGSDNAADPIGAAADAYGNQAEQILRLGLALGVDIHLVVDISQLEDSGVPPATLASFKEDLPIRLDAAYHRHHDLRFLRDAVQMTLSFDSLYTCRFPWASIQRISLSPLAPELDGTDDDSADDSADDGPADGQGGAGPKGVRRGHLRLVD